MHGLPAYYQNLNTQKIWRKVKGQQRFTFWPLSRPLRMAPFAQVGSGLARFQLSSTTAVV